MITYTPSHTFHHPCHILTVRSKSQSHLHSRRRDYTKMWASGGKNHWELFLIMVTSAYLPATDFCFIHPSLDKCLLSVIYMAGTWDTAVKRALGRGSCWQWAAVGVTLRTLAFILRRRRWHWSLDHSNKRLLLNSGLAARHSKASNSRGKCQ